MSKQIRRVHSTLTGRWARLGGDGYQLWDTTFKWRPIAPVFGSPEELVYWLAPPGKFAFQIYKLPFQKWLEFIFDENEVLSILIARDIEANEI